MPDRETLGQRHGRGGADHLARHDNRGTVTKRLYLLRHAKSSWEQTGLADHDRPLAGRGRRAARAITRHLEQHGVVVDLVLCSTARRARETLAGIEPALGAADVRYEPGLYGAGAGELLERLHGVAGDIGAVMLIGHNPAIEQLAHALARPSPRRSELEEGSSRRRRSRRSSSPARAGASCAAAAPSSPPSCARAIWKPSADQAARRQAARRATRAAGGSTRPAS